MKNQPCGLFGTLLEYVGEVITVDDSVSIKEGVELQLVLKKRLELLSQFYTIFFGRLK